MSRLENYEAGAASALVKLALVDGPRSSAPTPFESTLGAKVVGAGAPLALAGAGVPALARAAVPAVRAAWPAVRDTGKHVLNQMRSSPKLTTGLALGSAGLSALNGESPWQQVASGLTAPLNWYGSGAVAGAVGGRIASGAGKMLSRVPGINKIPEGIRNLGRAATEFAGQNGTYHAVDSAGQAFKPAQRQGPSWEVRPSNIPDAPMSRLDSPPPEMPAGQYGEPGAGMAAGRGPRPSPVEVANGARAFARQARRTGGFRRPVGARPFTNDNDALRFMQRNPGFTNQYLNPRGWQY